jgi:hypothetical protein
LVWWTSAANDICANCQTVPTCKVLDLVALGAGEPLASLTSNTLVLGIWSPAANCAYAVQFGASLQGTSSEDSTSVYVTELAGLAAPPVITSLVLLQTPPSGPTAPPLSCRWTKCCC